MQQLHIRQENKGQGGLFTHCHSLINLHKWRPLQRCLFLSQLSAVIVNNGGNIMYQKIKISAKQHTKYRIGKEPVKQWLCVPVPSSPSHIVKVLTNHDQSNSFSHWPTHSKIASASDRILLELKFNAVFNTNCNINHNSVSKWPLFDVSRVKQHLMNCHCRASPNVLGSSSLR